MNKTETREISFEQAVITRLSKSKAEVWLKNYAKRYKELITCYSCALMEMETKFKVLNEDFSLLDDSNPIESIKTRLKKPESIIDKMIRKGYELSVESMEENLNDIAGIRIICSFQSDIYKLADALISQDDIILIRKKDYIKNPKPNGYRSLHLIVGIPIFLHNEKKIMKVEVQLRTLAMDMWASIEHKLTYKKNSSLTPEQKSTLHGCSEFCDLLDNKMEELYDSVRGK